MRVVAPSDFRELARRRLPPFLFEYIDGGANAERTMMSNVADLALLKLRQRTLIDVSSVDSSVELFGRKHSLPLVLAPVGLAGMNARRGEVQAARAAEKAGVPFTLSTVSACALEEVADATAEPFWFQLYMIRDRGFMTDLLARAQATGCSALIFTVDMPVPGIRYRDYRSGLAGAPGIRGRIGRLGQALTHPKWTWDVGVRGRPHHLGNVAPVLHGRTGMEDFFAWMQGNFDASITWRDIEHVRANWAGPLIIKGVLDREDARAARDCGVDAIVVSNHGGRQLDDALSTAKALPPIVDAVANDLTIFVDGGIRTGGDIFKMIALGAHAVMIGRPWVYALAAQGQRGVESLIQMLETELKVTMALTGCATISEIKPSSLLNG